jgi:hypothetical protein
LRHQGSKPSRIPIQGRFQRLELSHHGSARAGGLVRQQGVEASIDGLDGVAQAFVSRCTHNDLDAEGGIDRGSHLTHLEALQQLELTEARSERLAAGPLADVAALERIEMIGVLLH